MNSSAQSAIFNFLTSCNCRFGKILALALEMGAMFSISLKVSSYICCLGLQFCYLLRLSQLTYLFCSLLHLFGSKVSKTTMRLINRSYLPVILSKSFLLIFALEQLLQTYFLISSCIICSSDMLKELSIGMVSVLILLSTANFFGASFRDKRSFVFDLSLQVFSRNSVNANSFRFFRLADRLEELCLLVIISVRFLQLKLWLFVMVKDASESPFCGYFYVFFGQEVPFL